MDILELANRLQFDDDFAFNEEIQTMFADLVIAIEERHGMLPDELDSTKRKFNSQRLLIHRFQKTGTKRPVHSDCASNNFLGEFGVSEIFSCFPAFLIHLLDRAFRAGPFPAGIAGHGDRGN